MTEVNRALHKEGDWTVVVEYDLMSDAVAVRMWKRVDGYSLYFLPNGKRQHVRRGEMLPTEPSFTIDPECKVALANALLGEDPATEQLNKQLKETLSTEQTRVDKMLDVLLSNATDR